METVTSHLFGRGRATRGNAGRAKAGASADRGDDAAMDSQRQREERAPADCATCELCESPLRGVRARVPFGGRPSQHVAGQRDRPTRATQRAMASASATAPSPDGPSRLARAGRRGRHYTTCPQRSIRLLAFTFGNLRETGLARLNGRIGYFSDNSSESLPREFWHTTRNLALRHRVGRLSPPGPLCGAVFILSSGRAHGKSGS